MNSHKQRKIGRVVSAQMTATVVVSVDSFISHPLYHKKLRHTRRFLAHNPDHQAKLGDLVVIEETRPLSKRKHWVVIEVKAKGDRRSVAEDLQAIDAEIEQA